VRACAREQRELALVAVHVAPVVPLDHLDRRPAVLGEHFRLMPGVLTACEGNV
jgi:hypothetical protein